MGLIIAILIWALIGWVAGKIMGSSYAWWLNIIIGIVGGWLGGWLCGGLLSGLGQAGPLNIGEIVTGIIGAILLIFIVRLIKK